MDIKVISSDIDGAALRREKARAKRHVRCTGSSDDLVINDAIQHRGNWYTLPSKAWDRIFGGVK